jgi:predicted DNA-binding transcriptional regulator AlpA
MNSAIENLPENLARRRLVNIQQTAEFVGRSVAEIRRLLATGEFPKPLKLNGRRLSWQVGVLVDYVDGKAAQQQQTAA